jgi:hypothetical protein
MFDFLDGAIDTVKEVGSSAKRWLTKPAMPEAISDPEPGGVVETISDFTSGVLDEGFAGLLDPAGMMDRQDAKRDLAPYFGITPDDFEGTPRNNEVSQDQFDEIAKTYSDIRMGRGDIQFDTSEMANEKEEAKYRDAAMTDIAMIMQTPSGRRLIDTMNDNRTDYRTVIQPSFYSVWDEREEKTFDHAAGGDGRAIAGEDGVEELRYKPGGPAHNYGNRSDVILAHELEHARHHMNGTIATGDFYGGPKHPDSPHFDPVEDKNVVVPNAERQATGLTNLDGLHPTDGAGCTENQYRYERNQIGDRLAPRTHYSGAMPGEEKDKRKLATMWRRFLASNDEVVDE